MANAQVRVPMVDTVRGGQHLFYEGFKFRCKKKVREKKYWNCVVAACRASVITENGILQAALQLDFEIAAHNVVRSAFPNTLIRGCYFHFTQCIWRRVQKEGLATDDKNDDEVRRLVRRAAALPLLPLDKVDDVWLQAIADSPAGRRVAAFMDYVTTTWVEY
ncbi:uncharacterized protein LOC124121619 [Haliotis rufescens]|uniref:uncharacterized protein LOC124121619 n=1 Tax=Haliotis rufescens TaxID=6454 RepID=UPI001EB038C0|nr:uncharacterized protein LOC124121619 [Haliotis rufescens]